MRILIRGGHIIDPLQKIDAPGDVAIAAGRVVAVGQVGDGFAADQTIDARGLVVAPGLVDLSARLREPGYEYRATLERIGKEIDPLLPRDDDGGRGSTNNYFFANLSPEDQSDMIKALTWQMSIPRVLPAAAESEDEPETHSAVIDVEAINRDDD